MVATRKPTAERREEICQAVLRIIGEQGLTSFTTTVLAEEVGVTSGALFRHFTSRDDILCETVRYGLGKIESTFPDPALPPLDRLLTLARNRIRLLGSDPGLAWLLRSDQARLTLPEEAVSRLVTVVERSKSFILAALREGAAQGAIRTDIEPEILMVPFMGTVHAIIGMQGVHKLAAGDLGERPERTLDALVRLIEPPVPAHS
jgi:AcrR family transcriptional regulator